jgi:hypothetical protein
MATIITKNGSGSAVPALLTQGELAINVDSGTLYYGSGSANAVRTITASLALSASYLIGGGGGTPGGANTTIQFNDAGAFSGSGNFTFNKSTNAVSLTGLLTTSGSIGINTPADAQSLLHIDGGPNVNRVIMDADNNVARIFSFRTDNSQRWAFRVDGNETGANAGANFQLRRYADNGVFIDAPISLNRSTGNITLSHGVTGTSFTGSLSGTASYALTASFALNGGGGGVTILKKENITLASGSWVSASLYEYSYTDTDIASSSSIVDFTPNTASFTTVVDAIVYPTVVVTTGTASFFATNQPANDITGELVITNI